MRATRPSVVTWRARCTVHVTRWSSRGSPWAPCGHTWSRRPPGPLPLPCGAPGGGGRGPHVIDTTGTRWDGDLVVVATGAAYDHLPGTEALGARLRRVRLQMLETAPFAPTVTTALADADTLRYYPAYEVAPLGLLGRAGRGGRRSTISSCCWSSVPTAGSPSATPTPTASPSTSRCSEDPTEELLGRARRILGVDLPRCGGAGRASTRNAPTAGYACGRRSVPACSS